MSKTSSTSPPSTTDTGSMTGLAASNEPVLPTCGMPRRFRGLDVCACAKAVSIRGSGACFRRSARFVSQPPKRKVAGPAWGTKFLAFPQVSGGFRGDAHSAKRRNEKSPPIRLITPVQLPPPSARPSQRPPPKAFPQVTALMALVTTTYAPRPSSCQLVSVLC